VYVSPQVWASRPGRARKMRGYIDRILAVYPFEEQVHEKLGGPPCVYVGHPLVERAGDLRPTAEEACRRGADPAIVLLLPGSRPRELRHLIEPFGDAVELVASRAGAIQLILPTVPSLTESLKEVTAGWATIADFLRRETERPNYLEDWSDRLLAAYLLPLVTRASNMKDFRASADQHNAPAILILAVSAILRRGGDRLNRGAFRRCAGRGESDSSSDSFVLDSVMLDGGARAGNPIRRGLGTRHHPRRLSSARYLWPRDQRVRNPGAAPSGPAPGFLFFGAALRGAPPGRPSERLPVAPRKRRGNVKNVLDNVPGRAVACRDHRTTVCSDIRTSWAHYQSGKPTVRQ
jgi:hypothetical protein